MTFHDLGRDELIRLLEESNVKVSQLEDRLGTPKWTGYVSPAVPVMNNPNLTPVRGGTTTTTAFTPTQRNISAHPTAMHIPSRHSTVSIFNPQNTDALLLTGPVIQEVTENTVTVMLEVDIDAGVTCVATTKRVGVACIRKSAHLKAKTPRSLLITGLCPDTEYEISVENIDKDTTAAAFVKTLPLKMNFDKFRVAVVNGDDDSIADDDVNPWVKLARLVDEQCLDIVVHMGSKTQPLPKNLQKNSKNPDLTLEPLRVRYRESWSKPDKAAALAGCANTMLMSGDEQRTRSHCNVSEMYQGQHQSFIDMGMHGVYKIEFSPKNGLSRSVKSDLSEVLETSGLCNLVVCIDTPLLDSEMVGEWEADIAWLLELLFDWKDNGSREAILICSGSMAASSEIHCKKTKSLIRCITTGVITASPGAFTLCADEDFVKGYTLRHEYEPWEGDRSFVTLEVSVNSPRVPSIQVEFHTAVVETGRRQGRSYRSVTRSY